MPQCYQRPRALECTGGTWRMIARCIACRGKAAGDGREHVFWSSIWLPATLRAAEYSQAVRSAQSRIAGRQGHFGLRNRFARVNPVRSNQGGGGPGNGASHGCEHPGNAGVSPAFSSRRFAPCGRDAPSGGGGLLGGRGFAPMRAGRPRSQEEPFSGRAVGIDVWPRVGRCEMALTG